MLLAWLSLRRLCESVALQAKKKKKKKRKPKWQHLEDHANVYVTGLPPDISEEEVAAYFKKAGIIKEDPLTSTR